MIDKNNSEAVRRASLKKQREIFKEKEQLIKNSLKSVDGLRNNKIIFDDNIEEQIKKQDDSTEKRALFDDEGGENYSIEEEFDFSDKRRPKVINLGNDARFAINEKFLESEAENEERNENFKKENENVFEDEKNKELEILQSILGKPVIRKTDKQGPVKRQNQMIRYDPAQNDHGKHELKQESRQPKKKRRKTSVTEVREEKPIPVSNEIFYSVAENLRETLQAPEEFSLLKRFGTAPPEKNKNEDEYASKRRSNYGEHLDAKNPFKYDSSDDEDDNQPEIPVKNATSEKQLSNIEETFFLNSSIFKDAEEFFKAPASCDTSFNNLRKELKQVIRSKIRNNLRKTQTWKRRKINNKPRQLSR